MTLQCLRALFCQKGLGVSYFIDVFLVDDGCMDGTADAIRLFFPSVKLIQGNGNLYWNRGMYLAWEKASMVNDYDYYLWLNDDTFLFNDAFEILLREKFSLNIICGSTTSQVNHKTTYGGFKRNSHSLLLPNGKYQNADYCNGNCVLIPRKVFMILGNLDFIFHHALGDYDYTLRARSKGILIKIAPKHIGICESHDNVPKWRSHSLNVTKRLKILYSPLSGCNPPEYFAFEKRHNGIFIAIKNIISVHVRCLFPKLFN